LPIFAGGAAEWIEYDHGVVGYDDTAKLPWVDFRKHDAFRPEPDPVVAEPILLSPPSDAVVLFDGKGLDAWQDNLWTLREGLLIAGEGDLQSKAVFGDCQIHLEFRIPEQPSRDLGNRGNSGVFPMSFYEIQIFDAHPMHAVKLYPDGQCAAIYGETPPLKNACRKPGEWQSFDILFTAPRFLEGRLVAPARVTLFHNGVLVHLNEPVRGPTTHKTILTYEPHAPELPFKIQGHGSSVAFRNIWVRKLD
jgi:hypothetical protein